MDNDNTECSKGESLMFDYLAFSGVLISFCGAFISIIPIVWYERLSAVRKSFISSRGDIVFGETIEVERFNNLLQKQGDYAILGVAFLGAGVLLDCLGLVISA